MELDTPAAVVDADRLDRNLERWQAYCDRVGLASRPHVKTHRSVEIARRQLALGAAGIACQKLSEAETMVKGGLEDVLVPYNIVGARKLERLARLLERAVVRVSVDDDALLGGLAETAHRSGRELSVLVECDTGLGRTGVGNVERAAELASLVARSRSLRFDGFLTHPSPPAARAFLEQAVARARRAGLEVPTVSAGGTPSMWESERLRPVVNEYRVGTYAFHDRSTVAGGAAALDDVALTVAATVVSRRCGHAVLDAGSKSLSSDPAVEPGFGLIREAPRSTIVRLDEEHAYVAVDAEDEDALELGRQVRIVPNHACVVSNLFDEFVVLREGEVVACWPVDARGRSQ